MSPGANSYPFTFGLPFDTRQQQLFVAFPGIVKSQPTTSTGAPPLAAFRNGPVRANNDGRKTLKTDPVGLKVEGTAKGRKSKSAKQRPASPGIKGNSIFLLNNIVALESTYNIYVGSLKPNTTTKQKYRIKSANPEKVSPFRDHNHKPDSKEAQLKPKH